MRTALQMAEATKGQTTPNPAVGAVVVKEHRVVGFGAHLRAGEAHAERHALTMAGEKAYDATIYVTLEPCSHQGRTPPCCDAIIEAGIRRVVVATMDANPKVAGNGIKKLRQAGIEVDVGVCREAAEELNQSFFHYMKTNQPYVTLKVAASIDGKIATSTGESQWITSSESRADGHVLRHQHDAILVGVNTVVADDPKLTTRLPEGGENPIRVILDHTLRTPLSAQLVTDKSAPTWIVTTKKADAHRIDEFEKNGVSVLVLKGETIEVDELLVQLSERGVTSVLVEGGGTIHDAFLRSGSFQQIVYYMAVMLIGGSHAPDAFSGMGISSLKDVPRLAVHSWEKLGSDMKMVLRKGEE
nr:bifunctional diaminohydroxyphosphoribosylaminopyrimidine deaminase/5-amino-6-(5-phosphoribosylamino)uracil reductase RibD [Texcoconibacillus texcoconensis]